MMMITMDNYEEYIIMHADGELQPHEEQALMDFLAQHPQLQGEMDIYSNIRLVPDTEVVFAGKEQLLKPVAEPRIIPMPWYRNYAVAAGVAAVVVLAAAFMLRNGGDAANTTSNSQLAANAPVVQPATPATHASQPTKAPGTDNTTPTENKTAATHSATVNSAVQPATVPHGSNYMAAHTPTPKQQHPNAGDDAIAQASHNQPQQVKTADMAEMRQGSYKALPVDAPVAAGMAMAELPEISTPGEEKRSWFDKLPLDENKKKNINNVATAIASGCEKISTLKDNAARFGFSMRVEKKNLIVSF